MNTELFLKEPQQIQSIPDEEFLESMDENVLTDERILCRNCQVHITEKKYEIRINDAGYHLFKNPAGIYFRVVCFSAADGSTVISDYTDENTWFSGFFWAIALCGSCHTHLGWHFQSVNSSFFGLIADRLTGI